MRVDDKKCAFQLIECKFDVASKGMKAALNELPEMGRS
jgi:hypothetical protein